MQQVEQIFKKDLGEDVISLYKIHQDWKAFVNNATNKNNKIKSKLNNGIEKINLQLAFVKTMKVFGATCIHIASSKYKFEFDYMIMDESSRATCTEALVPINMSKKLDTYW